MNYNAKAKLATLLRKKSIPYQTVSGFLFIGNVSICFIPDTETVIFNDNRFSYITFKTHFYAPETLLQKLEYFRQMIKAVSRSKAIFNIPICNN